MWWGSQKIMTDQLDPPESSQENSPTGVLPRHQNAATTVLPRHHSRNFTVRNFTDWIAVGAVHSLFSLWQLQPLLPVQPEHPALPAGAVPRRALMRDRSPSTGSSPSPTWRDNLTLPGPVILMARREDRCTCAAQSSIAPAHHLAISSLLPSWPEWSLLSTRESKGWEKKTRTAVYSISRQH